MQMAVPRNSPNTFCISFAFIDCDIRAPYHICVYDYQIQIEKFHWSRNSIGPCTGRFKSLSSQSNCAQLRKSIRKILAVQFGIQIKPHVFRIFWIKQENRSEGGV